MKTHKRILSCVLSLLMTFGVVGGQIASVSAETTPAEKPTVFKMKAVDNEGNPVQGLKFTLEPTDSSQDDLRKLDATAENGETSIDCSKFNNTSKYLLKLVANENYTYSGSDYVNLGYDMSTFKNYIKNVNGKGYDGSAVTITVNKVGGGTSPEKPAPTVDKNVLNIKVVDESGKAVTLADDELWLEKADPLNDDYYFAATNEKGEISLDVREKIQADTYTVNLDKEGYELVEDTKITITKVSDYIPKSFVDKVNGKDYTGLVTIKVRKTGDTVTPPEIDDTVLKIKTVDTNNNPVPGIALTLKGNEASFKLDKTNDKGILNQKVGIWSGEEKTIVTDTDSDWEVAETTKIEFIDRYDGGTGGAGAISRNHVLSVNGKPYTGEVVIKLKKKEVKPTISSVEVDKKSVSKDGDEVTVTVKGTALPENMYYTPYIRAARVGAKDVQEFWGNVSDKAVQTEGTTTERTFKVTLPALKTFKYEQGTEEGYKIAVMLKFTGTATKSNLISFENAGTEPSVDKNVLNIKVVDESGKAVTLADNELWLEKADPLNDDYYFAATNEKGEISLDVREKIQADTYTVNLDKEGYELVEDTKLTITKVSDYIPKSFVDKVNDKDYTGLVTIKVRKTGGVVTPPASGDKVFCEGSTFKAKVVDKDGQPVEGVTVHLADTQSLGTPYDVKSDDKGIVSKTLNARIDYELTYNATVADTKYSSKDEHTFKTGTKAVITEVNGNDPSTTEMKFVVEAGGTVKEPVLCDKGHFRAVAVDKEFNPVEGVEFEVKNPYTKAKTIVSNKDGVIEYAPDTADDQDVVLTITLKDNAVYSSNDEYKVTTNEMSEIFKINGDEHFTEELSFILHKKIDKTALGEALDEVKDIDKADYTTESWSDYALVLDKVKGVYRNDFVNQDDVDGAISELKAAVAKLKPVALNTEAAEVAKAAFAKLVETDYQVDAWNAVKAAIDEADKAKLQSKLNTAVEKLNEAIKALDNNKKTVDKTAAEAAKADLAKLVKSDYTEESWKAVEDASKALDAAIESANLQSKLDAAVKAVNDAVAALKKNEPAPGPTPGGGSTGGGGGVAPSTPSKDPITNNKDNSGNVSTDVNLGDKVNTENGKADVKLDKDLADKVVENATTNKSESVVLNVATSAGNTAKTEVSVPTETLKDIDAKTDAKKVTIKTDNGSVSMDKAALKAITEQAGSAAEVKLVVEIKESAEDKVVIELKLVTANGEIHDFKGGKVTVTVPVKNTSGNALVAVYIDDNGKYTKIGGKLTDAGFVFETGHFSQYAVMTEEAADAAIKAQEPENPAKPVVKSVALTSVKAQKKAMKVTWKKSAKKVSGYQVRYSTSKSFKTCKTVGVKYTKKVNSRTVKSLKSGKRYYVKVRTYVKNADGTYYSKWSKVKSVKVK